MLSNTVDYKEMKKRYTGMDKVFADLGYEELYNYYDKQARESIDCNKYIDAYVNICSNMYKSGVGINDIQIYTILTPTEFQEETEIIKVAKTIGYNLEYWEADEIECGISNDGHSVFDLDNHEKIDYIMFYKIRRVNNGKHK